VRNVVIFYGNNGIRRWSYLRWCRLASPRRLRWKRPNLMQDSKAVRYAPVLNQLTIFEATNIDNVDGYGFSRSRITTCRSATRSHSLTVLYNVFNHEG
jgi:hypothetical protein